jgi:hypothetical protein
MERGKSRKAWYNSVLNKFYGIFDNLHCGVTE